MQEFGCFALKDMADELEDPSQEEENRSVTPQPVEEDAGQEDDERK